MKQHYITVSAQDGVFSLKSLYDLSFHLWQNNLTALHKHDDYIEIFVVTKGKLVNRINNVEYNMKAGDVCVMFPNDYHMHYSNSNDTCELLNITCKISLASPIIETLHKKDIFISKSDLFFLNKIQFNTVLSFKSQLLAIPNNYEPLVYALFSYLIGLFYQTQKTDPSIPSWLHAFLTKIDTVDFATMKINELYKLSGYSQSILSINFKKYFGVTLVQYINKRKIEYARNLLRRTNLSILDIAMDLGFFSVSHFNHLFKKETGLTPSQYRNKHS